MPVMHKDAAAARGLSVAPLSIVAELAQRESLTALIHGLGGQGVVSLTRLLAQALQMRFARTASVETRGIAQRRAPVKAMVRAGADIRSAASPDTLVNFVIALETSEVLRAANLLRPGCHCLLSDLALPVSAGEPVPLGAAEIRRRLEARGVGVIPLQVQHWLAAHRGADALASTIAFGALAALLGLPLERCKALLCESLSPRRRPENEAAFGWGVAQFARGMAAAPAAAARALPAMPNRPAAAAAA